MVQREMDAGFIQKLKDQQVALLPYVSNATYRERLRLDVQSLQTPEWNASNYDSMFPRIVAEIWRAYLERMIPAATAEERARRLEAELAVEKLRRDVSAGLFSIAEDKDFAYIHRTLNREEILVLSNREVDYATDTEPVLQSGKYRLNLLSFIIHLSKEQLDTLDQTDIEQIVADLLKRDNAEFPRNRDVLIRIDSGPDFADILRMFGLATWIERMEHRSSQSYAGARPVVHHYQVPARRTVFTDKIQRLRYWLATNDIEFEPAKLTAVIPLDLPQLK